MKALVYQGPGKKEWTEVKNPEMLKPTDAIVKITRTTICGTDLHILKGDVPAVIEGRVLGHEGIGIVEEVGEAVTNFKKGDHVLISCVTSCGKCNYCKKQLYAHCEDGGWILGHKIDGTQAEFVRIPHADNSLHKIPEGVKEEALLMLSDILPTGFEIGVLSGKVKPGDAVVIVGAGPVGMATLLTAQFYSPSRIILVDLDEERLKVGFELGATDVIDSGQENVVDAIMNLTNEMGVDVAIEAVGIPATFEICQKIIRPGGHIANVGVHGKSVELHLQELWIKNITITTGLVSTYSTPMLLQTLKSGKIGADRLITHRFKLSEMMKAYEVFENASKEKAMKVYICSDDQ
ncbi:MAG: zinc-dependent alcohol dehydrogenase family protein [Bacteriovoracaceae bacterium]